MGNNRLRGDIEVNFNGKSAVNSIRELEETAKAARASFEAMSESEKAAFGKDFEEMIKANEALVQKAKKAAVDVDQIMQNLSGTTMRKLQEGISQVKKNMRNLSEEQANGAEGKKYREQLVAMTTQLDKVQASLSVNKKAIGEVTTESVRLADVIKNRTARSADELRAAIAQVNKELNGLSQADAGSAVGKKLKAQHAALTDQLNRTNEALGRNTREIRQNDAAVNVSDIVKKRSRATLEELRQAMAEVTKQQNQLTREQAKGVQGKKLAAQQRLITEEYNRTSEALGRNTNEINKNNRSIKDSESVLTKTAKRLASYVLVYASFNQAIRLTREWYTGNKELSESLTNVRKVTGLTATEIDRLSKSIDDIDTSTAQLELTQLAFDAGKLGIKGTQNLYEFVRAGNQIRVALGADLGEDAIKNLAKLNDVLGYTKKLGVERSMLATGSAINELGMNFTTAEGYLVDFAQRLGGVAAVTKLSMPDLLALGGTLDALGQNVEVSATAMNKFLMTMMSGGAKMEGVARSAGMSLEELQGKLDVSTMEGLVSVFQGLSDKGDLEAMGDVFKDLGSDGARLKGVIAALVPNIDLLRAQIYVSNKGFDEAVSITNEYAMKQESLGAIAAKTGNRIKEAFVNSDMVTWFTGLANSMNNTHVWMSRHVEVIGLLQGAFVPLTAAIVLNKAHLTSWMRISAMTQISAIKLGKGITSAALAFGRFAMTPFGAFAIGATVVAAIGRAIYKTATHTTTAERAMKDYQHGLEDVTLQVNSSFAKLNRMNQAFSEQAKLLASLEKGTKDYADADKKLNDEREKRNAYIQELNKEYSPYLANMLTEKDMTDGLTVAKQHLISAMKEEQALKAKDRVTKDIREEYAGDIKKWGDDARTNLNKQGGDKKVTQDAMELINQIILQGVGDGTSYHKVWREIKESLKGDKFEGKFDSFNEKMVAPIRAYAEFLYTAEREIKDATDKYARDIDKYAQEKDEAAMKLFSGNLNNEVAVMQTTDLENTVAYYKKRIEAEGTAFEEYEKASLFLINAEQELNKRKSRQPREPITAWSIDQLESEMKVAQEGIRKLSPAMDNYEQELNGYQERIARANEELLRRKNGAELPAPTGNITLWSIAELKKDMANAKREMERLRPDADDYEAKLSAYQDRIEAARMELVNRRAVKGDKTDDADSPNGTIEMWSVAQLKSAISSARKEAEALRPDAEDYVERMRALGGKIDAAQAELIRRKGGTSISGDQYMVADLAMMSVNDLRDSLRKAKKESDALQPEADDYEQGLVRYAARMEAIRAELLRRGEKTTAGYAAPNGDLASWSVNELRKDLRNARKELDNLRPDAEDFKEKSAGIIEKMNSIRLELIYRGEKDESDDTPLGAFSLWSVAELKKEVRACRKQLEELRPDTDTYAQQAAEIRERIDKVQKELASRGDSTAGMTPIGEIATWSIMELRASIRTANTELAALRPDMDDYELLVKEICDRREAANRELNKRGFGEEVYIRPTGNLTDWSVEELKTDIRRAKKEAASLRPDAADYEKSMKEINARIAAVREELARRGEGSGSGGGSRSEALLKALRTELKAVETEYRNHQTALNQAFVDGKITQMQLQESLRLAEQAYYTRRAEAATAFGIERQVKEKSVVEEIANVIAENTNKVLEVEVDRQKKLSELYYAFDPVKKVREEFAQRFQELNAFGKMEADMTAEQQEERLRLIDSFAGNAVQLESEQFRSILLTMGVFRDQALSLTTEQLIAMQQLYDEYYTAQEEALLKSEERKLRIIEKRNRLVIRNYNQSDQKRVNDGNYAKADEMTGDANSQHNFGAMGDMEYTMQLLDASNLRIETMKAEMEAKRENADEVVRLNGLIVAEQEKMTDTMMDLYSRQMDHASQWGEAIGDGLWEMVNNGEEGRKAFVKSMAKMTVDMVGNFAKRLLMEKAFNAASLAMKSQALVADQAMNTAKVAGTSAATATEVGITATGTAATGTLAGASWMAKAIGTLGPIAGPILGALGVSMIMGFISAALSKTKSVTGVGDATSAMTKKPAAGMLTYATGKYDVLGNDGVTYNAQYAPSLQTGVYDRPHFGIFSEKQPEMVIDGPTTRKMVTNYPQLYNDIMYLARNGRMQTYATGKMDYAVAAAPSDSSQLTEVMAMMQASLAESARVNAELRNQIASGLYVNNYGKGGISEANEKAERFKRRNRINS